MTQQNTQNKQGFFVVGEFDRMIIREKKNDDGTFKKSHYVGLILYMDASTQLCQVRTKTPEKYAHFKPHEIVSMQVFPRAFKDNIYYSDE